MLQRRRALIFVTALFGAALLLSYLSHGTGVVRNDPARNIWIPSELTMPLQLRVAYNDRQIFFRYRWPAKEPHVFADCHGDDGKGDDESPDIVKLTEKEFVKAIHEYQSGARTKDAKMARAAKKLSAAEVANLAAYYETLK